MKARSHRHHGEYMSHETRVHIQMLQAGLPPLPNHPKLWDWSGGVLDMWDRHIEPCDIGRPDSPKSPCHAVYLVSYAFEDTGRLFYKVGATSSPCERMRSLRQGCFPYIAFNVERLIYTSSREKAIALEHRFVVSAFGGGFWIDREYLADAKANCLTFSKRQGNAAPTQNKALKAQHRGWFAGRTVGHAPDSMVDDSNWLSSGGPRATVV